MNNQDLDDLKGFFYTIVKKSVSYELNPNRENLELLKSIVNNLYSCLSKKARDYLKSIVSEILKNISSGLEKLKELEKKQEQKFELLNNELKQLKEV